MNRRFLYDMYSLKIYFKIPIFQTFSLEKDGECQYDYVLVDTGYEERENRLCGTITRNERKVQISRLNKMEIRFQTDVSHVERGFKAVYETGKHSLKYQ